MPSGFASGLSFLGDAAGKVGDMAKGAVGGAANLAGDAVGAAGDAAGKVGNIAKGAVGGAANVAGNVAGAAGDAAGTAAKAGGGLLKWLLPILLLLGVASYFGLRTPVGDKVADVTGNVMDKAGDAAGAVAGAAGDAAGKVGDMAGDAAGKVGDMIGGAFSNINEAAKGALDKITFAAGSAGSQMMDYVKGGFKGDPNFTFKGLTFATGSSNINAATAAEVDNVAAILKTYPDVKVAVTGYTDNTGNAASNVKLSKARAQAVKTRLVAKGGIAANRIVANGLGSANPVGDNGTDAGRKANRRIEMKIVK